MSPPAIYFNETAYSYVRFYEFFTDGGFNVNYSNQTVVYFPVEVVDNSTCSYEEQRWYGSNNDLTCYWAPEYWNDWGSNSGFGLYWTGSAWTLGKY